MSIRKITLTALALVSGVWFAWSWLARSPAERAAMRLTAASGEGYVLRPGIVDCPSDVYERFRADFLKGAPALRESTDLLTRVDDGTVVALLRGGDSAALSNLRSAAPGVGIVVGACDGERIRLAAVAATGDAVAYADLPLYPSAVNRTPRLHVVTRPAGAQVWLDGKPAGTTPLLLTDLAPGPRRLRVHDPRFIAIVEDLNLAAATLTRRDYALRRGSGHLAVVSRPAGAGILVDGTPWPAATPALVGPLPSGLHRVELRAAGFAPLRAEADVPSQATANLALAFPGAQEQAPGKIWREPKTGMEMVWVPPGCYRRGCGPWTEDCDPDEHLGRDVCVGGFWIGKYEVTQAQWRQVMGSDPSSGQRGNDRPVHQVSWHAARAFAARLGPGFRLPTEAEWEYACRSGGRPEIYAGASIEDDHRAGAAYVSTFAWVGRRWEEGPFPVGRKQPNGLGIFDMSGNVWEWTEDSFRVGAYAETPPNNPLVAGRDSARVVRGGSWFNFTRLARCSHRDRFDANFANIDLGLRVVRAAPDPSRQGKMEVRR